MARRKSAAEESQLGTGGLLGSDQRRLGTGGLLRSDARRISPGRESVLAQEREQGFWEGVRQQNIASSASLIGKVATDNGDNTYTITLPEDGGSLLSVGAQPGAIVLVDSWVTVERAGPGWLVRGPAPYQAG